GTEGDRSSGRRTVVLFHESTFERHWVSDDVLTRKASGEPVFRRVAREFFETHPEPTLWADARVGEVWAVQIHGEEIPCRVIEASLSMGDEGGIAFLPVDQQGRSFFRPSEFITAARRIWPVES